MSRRWLPVSVNHLGDDGFGSPAIEDTDWSSDGFLTTVVIARVVSQPRAIELDAGALRLGLGDTVVFDSDRGPSLAVVTVAPRRVWLTGSRPPKVTRRAIDSDLLAERRARLREAQLTKTASQTLHRLGIAAKLVKVDCAFDNRRVTVHLASEDRLDLREFGRQLGHALNQRVELRHVGVRDAARIIGGVGPCGMQLCCNTFLDDFAPVSIRHAKDQGLALKPERVSGVCGRLMCCLVYEDAFYRQQRALFPKPNKRVVTPKGPGRVRDVDVLARTVRVSLDDGGLETFTLDQLHTASPRPDGSAP